MYFDDKSKTYLTHDNLRLLFRLRNIAIAAQSATILLAIAYLKMALPLWPIISAVALLCVFNVYTRYRINQPRPVSLHELVVQLCVDIIILTVLLGLSGGASNPFAILYLLPLTITAILLPTRVTWGLAALTVLCYTSLLVIYVPMPHAHNHQDAFNLHIVGMRLGFVLSAGVIAYFIVGLQKIIQHQANALKKAQEEAFKSEQLVKLGVLAASTAHDLGTPLNSMALLLEDIEYDEAKQQPQLLDKTRLMREQIDRCRQALATLSKSAGTVSLKGGRVMPLAEYLQTLIRSWRQQHPQTAIELSFPQTESTAAIMADEVLNLALTNIVDNAIEVSPQRIDIHAHQHGDYWDLEIRDYGPGLNVESQQQIGKQGYSTKQYGMGLGLFLSHTIIERLGGIVQLSNHPQGGLCTHIQLPAEFEQVRA